MWGAARGVGGLAEGRGSGSPSFYGHASLARADVASCARQARGGRAGHGSARLYSFAFGLAPGCRVG
eukprot:7247283-Prymnesium_polylepis.2